ncbi:MAG TPA: hypothetical protein VGM51_04905 [Armatimonadota bacterium]|jgi:hypothetical protein
MKRFAMLVLSAAMAAGITGSASAAPKDQQSTQRKVAQGGTIKAMPMGGMKGMKGGMGMMMTPDARKLRKHVDAVKVKAAKNGRYDCCIGPSCDFCATHMGSCSCAKGVASGMGNCRECKGGWEAGQGDVPGKTKADVRKMKTVGM